MTLDGSPHSAAFGGAPSRLIVGQTYFLPGGGENGRDVVGKVHDVTVVGAAAYVSVTDIQSGGNFLSKVTLTEAELAD